MNPLNAGSNEFAANGGEGFYAASGDPPQGQREHRPAEQAASDNAGVSGKCAGMPSAVHGKRSLQQLCPAPVKFAQLKSAIEGTFATAG